jgi:hypothetical protein
MTGILAKLDTMNGHLQVIADSLSGNTYGAVAGSLANFIGSINGAIVSNEFAVNLGTGPNDLENQVKLLRQALVPDGFQLTLSERIAADKSASLAQRIVQDDANDPAHTDLGAIADRISCKPSDVQCDAADNAWQNPTPQPSTPNLSDAIADLFGNWP